MRWGMDALPNFRSESPYLVREEAGVLKSSLESGHLFWLVRECSRK